MPATNESPRQFATMGFSFCAKARNPEWGSSDFTNSWFWNYSSRHETKLKNQRDLVWRKKNGWWPGNQVSTHFVFVPLDEDAWIKRGLGNIKKLTSRAKRCRQRVYHTKKKKKKKSIHLECQQWSSAQRASCHNKLIDKNCHWLCFIFRVLLRGRIPSASYVNWGLLPDLGDQFSVRESWLMDHCVAATALKITSNTFSNTLLNYVLDLQRGANRWIV